MIQVAVQVGQVEVVQGDVLQVGPDVFVPTAPILGAGWPGPERRPPPPAEVRPAWPAPLPRWELRAVGRRDGWGPVWIAGQAGQAGRCGRGSWGGRAARRAERPRGEPALDGPEERGGLGRRPEGLGWMTFHHTFHGAVLAREHHHQVAACPEGAVHNVASSAIGGPAGRLHVAGNFGQQLLAVGLHAGAPMGRQALTLGALKRAATRTEIALRRNS